MRRRISDFFRRADAFAQKRTWLCTLCVVCFFLLTAAAAHFNFILWSETMPGLRGSDELSQMAPAVSFIEDAADNGQLFWSWSYGLGGEPYSEFIYYYTSSPLFWISYLIKRIFGATGGRLYDVQRWKVLFGILKQAGAMLSMYALLRYEGKRRSLACVSGAVYGLSAWFFCYSLRFDYMPDIMLYLPLAVLAWRYYIKEKRMLPLSIAIAVIIGNNLLTGYMCCILLASVFIVFSDEQGGGVRARVRYIARLIPPVAIGVLLSAIAFVPAVSAFLSIDRTGGGAVLSLLPSGEMLKSALGSVFNADGLLWLPPVILLAPAIKWREARPLCRRKSVLAVIWLASCVVPAAYIIMSGFSYVSDRWYFVPVFACAYALPDWMEELTRICGAERKKCAAVTAVCGACAVLWGVWSIHTAKNFDSGLRFRKEIILVFALAGVLSAVAAAGVFAFRRAALRRAAAWIMACTFALSGAAHCLYISVSNSQFIPYYYELKEFYLTGSAADEAAAAELKPKDGSFYRVSDGAVAVSSGRLENRSWLERSYTDSAYNSLIDGELHRYLKRDLLVYQRYVQPSFYRGFNDRLFLETAWGIKYKLNAPQTAGWQSAALQCGKEALQNPYSVGLDMWYTSVIDSDVYDSMTLAQKDAALLQAVRSDDLAGEYEAAQLDSVTEQCDIDLGAAQLSECTYTDGVLTAQEGAQLTLPLPQREDEGEYLLCVNIIEQSDRDFTLTVNGMASTRFSSNYEWSYELNDFAVRLPSDSETINIALTAGTYSISNVTLEYNSYQKLAEWVEAREKYSLENLNVKGGRISGTVDNAEDGILSLAIPYSSGWRCTVNGKKQEIIRANGMFCAIELAAGHNDIELEYVPRAFVCGCIITAATALLCACAAAYIFLKRKDRADK